MSYILLIIPLFLFLAMYSKKLKEPMIGYCYSEKTPYHAKQVHLLDPSFEETDKKVNKQLIKKIRTIRKSLEDKASWEHNKMNSYIPEYSTTQNNDLNVSPQEYELSLDNVSKKSIHPVVTQFDFIESSDNTPMYYMAPKYQYNYVNRFNKETHWPRRPYNAKKKPKSKMIHVLNFKNY